MPKHKRKLVISIIAKIPLILVLFSVLANGAVDEVYFAGIAFTGNALDTEVALPNSTAILTDEGRARVSRTISSALEANPPDNFEIISKELANFESGTSAVVLAATLERETVLIEKIGNDYKILVELAGQALFFDFKERQILFSYPITVQHIDLENHHPTSDEIQEILNDILFGLDNRSLAGNIAEKLRNITLPEIAARRLKVGSVVINEDIRASHGDLVSALFDTGIIGHEMSKILSDSLSISLLPFSSGQAIGGTMPMRFARLDVLDLKIPEADYEIRLNVTDFRGRTLEQTNAFRRELIGAFFNVDVIEPLSGKLFFSQSLRQGSTKLIPVTQESFDVGAAYYETLILGLREFSNSIIEENREWISQQNEPRQVSQEMETLRELVDASR